MKLLRGLLLSIGGVFTLIVSVALAAVITGTLLFWIWEPAMEPFQAITWLPAVLTWKQAVLLTWVFGILIKSTQINNNN